ncbi:AbrB/MazE/SpoVT family DNA-binding domain-containing protein [Bacillus bombysepticus]|uniref:AbrB/MazE/SpoVT family DNA-binding domain-containing protein n=1 Tax=Bacillus bombysepticus TaxID=658666 RepID=UPI0030177F10
MQKVQLKTWGNSIGLRVPRNILDALKLDVDSSLEISVDPVSKTIILKAEDGLTPYERLMVNGQQNKERNQVDWDRNEQEEKLYK